MRHLRASYAAIQPWPVRRPHHARVAGEVVTDTQLLPGDGGGDPEAEPQPLIPDDEPVFLLRGQDPAAARTVRAWAYTTSALGGDPVLVEAALRWADEMEAYAAQAGHGVADAEVADLVPVAS